MKKLAMVGLVGTAMVAGFAGVANAADEAVTPVVVTPVMTIESVPQDVGYAVSQVRSVDLQQMADRALAEPDVGAEITGTIGSARQVIAPSAALPEQDIASAAATTAVTRPAFESTKSATSEPVKRKPQKVSAQPEKKRVTLPVLVGIGVLR
jgi:hypothetical protein